MSKIKSPFRNILISTVFLVSLTLAGIQFIHPVLPNPPVNGDFQAPRNVKGIVKRACYDCHSNETDLRWYDQIAPIYWQVAVHVKEGREGLNFSNWKKLSLAEQKAKLWEAVNQVAAGVMPIKSYLVVHPSAKISAADLAVLKNYVNSMAAKTVTDDSPSIGAYRVQLPQFQKNKFRLGKLPVALNGIAYMPDYKNWEAISITDRFDNGTMRVIFGNDIAVKAIRENRIHPWPNGAIFAKVAWDQIQDKDGNIRTGAFRQVEYMIKNKQKYAATKGWGFARFKTPQMLPYSRTAMFATECINCHRPMAEEDFVFTQPIKF